MKKKRSKNQKRIVSGLLSLAMITTSMSAVLPASADAERKQEAYPYAVFAADEQGGIKLDLNYLTVNGNACTNGVYSTTAKYPNVNGTILENEAFAVDEVVTDDENTTDAQDSAKAFDISRDMIYIHNKLMTSWFKNSRNFDNDYTLSEMNINLSSPVYVTGKMSYDGNMALNTAIGAVSDVTLSGGNLNGNNAVIYSKFGNITIDESQASMNGLIYAPFGTVSIDCDNFNLNGIIIAQNVVINSRYGANINYSNTWAEFVGTETEELSLTFDDWKYLADTDKDGLPNIIEKKIGTKPYEADTDGDLLPDGYEYLTLGTSPLKVDTDNNGVSDYDEDFDEDGLSNGQEYEIGTDPYEADTDGDKILDGDEEGLGFDPTNPDTDGNGILDGDEYVIQTVSTDRFSEDLYIDNIAIPAITNVYAKKDINTRIKVEEYTGHLKGEERSYVGKVIEVKNADLQSGTVSFTLSEDYAIKDYEIGDTSTNGLLICYNDNNETIPLETEFDPETRTLYAEITSDGIYFVLDVIDWFYSLGIDLNAPYDEEYYEKDTTTVLYDSSETTVKGAEPKNTIVKESKLMRASLSAPVYEEPRIADIKVSGQVDIVFVVDTTGSMGGCINNVKNNLTAFVDNIKSQGITPNFALVKYEDITCDGLDSTQTIKNGKLNWFNDADTFKLAISNLKIGYGGDYPETAIDGLEMARQLDMRKSAQKFVILITDADYKVNNNYGIESMNQIANSFKSDNISVSVVTYSSVKARYEELYTLTDGIFADLSGNFKDELLTISDIITKNTNNGYWIALNGLIPQIVKLDEKPNPFGTADTDGDHLLDKQELKSTTPIRSINPRSYGYMLGINPYFLPAKIPVYLYYSNPAKKDTDGDNLEDDVDPEPLIPNTYYTAMVTSDGVSVRKGPGTDYDLIEDTYQNYRMDGEIVRVYEVDDSGTWAKIRLPENHDEYGWISTTYLEEKSESDDYNSVISQDYKNNVYNVTLDDYILICNAVGNESGLDTMCVTEKATVAAVIMNRVFSNSFPDTIREVIEQGSAFENSNDYNTETLYFEKVNEDVLEAVEQYFQNPDNYGNYLYFLGDGTHNYFSINYPNGSQSLTYECPSDSGMLYRDVYDVGGVQHFV